jgi:O-antigen ligase
MHILAKLAVVVVLALLLALLPLPLALALVAGSTVLLLSFIDPIWALYAAVLAVPFQALVTLPGGLSLVQAALLLAVGTWGLHILASPQQPVRWGRLLPGLALLVWALALSAVFTPYSRSEALKETLRWVTVVLVYLLALNSVANASSVSSMRLRAAGLVACMLLATGANALLGLWQFATGDGPPSFAIAGDFVRAYGTIGKPNSFAGYMNMGWALAVALALGAAWVVGRHWWQRLPGKPDWLALPLLFGAGGAVAVLLAALLASFSRGGWVGAAGGGVAMLLAATLLLGRQQRQRLWTWGALALVGGGVLLALVGNVGLLPDTLTRRAGSIVNNLRLFDVRTVEAVPANFAVVERMAHLQAAWAMLNEHPLTGVGAGNYTNAYEGRGGFDTESYLIHPWYTSRGHAHNYYLHIAAEAGMVGAAAYLLLLALLVVQVYQALIRVQGWFWRSILVGGCGIIAAVSVHNLFENLHVLNMGVQLGALWGLLGAIERHRDAI